MARNSGILIRQLFVNCSNPCASLHLHHHHHHRKVLSNCIQTLTLNSTPSTRPSPSLHRINIPPPCKLPFSSPNLHFLERSDSVLLFSRPPNMVIISNRDAYNRSIKEVKDGLLPAVFYCIKHGCSPVWTRASNSLQSLREHFPHVTIYKYISAPVTDMEKRLVDLLPDSSPKFLFYQNGKKVAEIDQYRLLGDTFEKLYRYVVPVETTQPESSSGMWERRARKLVIQAKKDENGMGESRAQQLFNVIQAKKDENGMVERRAQQLVNVKQAKKDENEKFSYKKGVVGGWKIGSVRELLQCRGAATLSPHGGGLVEAIGSSTAPSLDEVMRDVESLPGGHFDSLLWWYARGLFKYQPEKRVFFSKVQGPRFKVAWLAHERNKEEVG